MRGDQVGIDPYTDKAITVFLHLHAGFVLSACCAGHAYGSIYDQCPATGTGRNCYPRCDGSTSKEVYYEACCNGPCSGTATGAFLVSGNLSIR